MSNTSGLNRIPLCAFSELVLAEMLTFLGGCVFACSLAHVVYAQERAFVTVSPPNTPVYNGQRVTLTCSYGAGKVLSSVQLNGFNGTRREGSLWCDVGQANTTATGVFAGQSFVGCSQPVTAGATNVSVSMTATPSLALNYSCTAVVVRGSNKTQYVSMVMESANTSLEVRVLPSTPTFERGLALNQSDKVPPIICKSYGGSPVPLLRTIIIAPNGNRIEASGSKASISVLPTPLKNWHNATATCVVLNHNFPNMTTTRPVVINYIFSSGSPSTVFTGEGHAILDCSTYVSSFPSTNYRWSTPSPANSMQALLLRSPVFTVLQGQSGLFNCTATNSHSMKAVVIVFVVTNSVYSAGDSSESDIRWIAPVVAVIVIGIVIFIVLLVLFKRRAFSKRRPSFVSRQREQSGVLSTERSDALDSRVPAEEQKYEPLRPLPSDEQTYIQLHSHHGSSDWSHYANVARS